MAFCQVGDCVALGIRNEIGFGIHYLYIKPHSTRREEDKNTADKTVFVTNIPNNYNEKTVKEIFGRFGKVKSVNIKSRTEQKNLHLIRSEVYHENLTADDRFVFAHVIFKEPEAVERACSVSSQPAILPCKSTNATGMQKLINEYEENHPDPEKLQKEISEKVNAYDKRQQELSEKRKANSGPDKDGFVLVQHGKRKSLLEPKDAGIKKKKKRPLEDFEMYRWQAREKKREQLADLRRKFEDDKKRIQQMKANRKFKPM